MNIRRVFARFYLISSVSVSAKITISAEMPVIQSPVAYWVPHYSLTLQMLSIWGILLFENKLLF